MDTPHTHVWHDERGRRITSAVYIGMESSLYVHRFTDDPDDAADRPVLDGDAETDGSPVADERATDAADPDTGDRIEGLP